MSGFLKFSGGICFLVGISALLSLEVDNIALGLFCLVVGSLAILRGLIR